jgi:hypothetical protein
MAMITSNRVDYCAVSVWGEKVWYLLRGMELPEEITARRSVGHSHVMPPELRDPIKAKDVARHLTLKAASRLRRMQYYAGANLVRHAIAFGYKRFTTFRELDAEKCKLGRVTVNVVFAGRHTRVEAIPKCSISFASRCKACLAAPCYSLENSVSLHGMTIAQLLLQPTGGASRERNSSN